MARIIPGVQVTVVKEVVPPQLAPSGVLGLIGLTETVLTKAERASSWSRFLEVCGSASAYSIPEARQALANGVFELVIVPLKSSTAVKAGIDLPTADAEKFKLEARAPGIWANGFKLKVTYRADKFDLEIKPPLGDAVEVHRNLEPATVADFLEKASAVVRIDKSVTPTKGPSEGEYVLTGGKDAGATDYADALEALKDEPDVDMVLAAVQDFSDSKKVTQIYSAVISHCNLMSAALASVRFLPPRRLRILHLWPARYSPTVLSCWPRTLSPVRWRDASAVWTTSSRPLSRHYQASPA